MFREISPENQQRLLRESHRDIDEQLSSVIAQLKLQAESTFGGGKTWSEAGGAGIGDRLIKHGKELVDLGENFNSGKPPQWVLEQQAAYEKNAIGQLSRHCDPGKALIEQGERLAKGET